MEHCTRIPWVLESGWNYYKHRLYDSSNEYANFIPTNKKAHTEECQISLLANYDKKRFESCLYLQTNLSFITAINLTFWEVVK